MSLYLCEPIRKGLADGGGPIDRRTAIEREADKLAPEIGRAVRRAIEEHADRVSLDAIEEAIEAGDNARVLAMVGSLDAGRAAAISDALQDAVWAGGALGVGEAGPKLTGLTVAFNRLNPDLIRWLQGYSFDLIREIDSGTRKSVQQALVRGMQEGKSPIDQARQVRAAIGLTEKQERAVANYRKALETIHEKRSAKSWGLGAEIDRVNGRQVFKPDAKGKPKDGIDTYRLRDFRYDGVTARAMETGRALKPEQINRMVDAYRRKYLRHRSETIARTESLRALNVGVHEAWRQMIAAGQVNAALVRLRWITAADERTCGVCQPIPKLNPKRGIPWGEKFKTPIGPLSMPPAHTNCRCSLLIRQWEPQQLQKENTP